MELLRLLYARSPRPMRQILILTLISGAANAGLVALINAGAAAVSSRSTATREFIMFLVGLALFLTSKSFAELQGKQLIEQTVSEQRLRLFRKISEARVARIEAMSQGEMIAKTTRIFSSILQASNHLAYGLQSLIMLFFCMLYLLWLSIPAFLVVLTGGAALGLARHLRNQFGRASQTEVVQREGLQSEYLTSLFQGFKEIKINRAKREALSHDYEELVNETSDLGVHAARKMVQGRAVAQATFFITLGVVVFVVPRFSSTYTFRVLEITAVVLFIVGYMSGFLEVLPVFASSNASLASLNKIEAVLDAAHEDVAPVGEELRQRFADFQTISARGLSFSYDAAEGETPFRFGPVDLDLKRGETVFLVGGNGSGKSTLVKLLTGMYAPEGGALEVDGTSVGPQNIVALREACAVIMSDFHLFGRFYGYDHVDAEAVNALINDMRLTGKVTYAEGRFSTLNLSTGQRKRLAMIVALIEDKSLYVFDEWAADQDSHFRRHFYEQVLPELKRRGKTVLAVTHDELYWDRADRLIRLEYGKMAGS
ncbi:cyclic peptide export ABC transporter [Humidesulfovibrio idahonensis]